jgi:hypothetical protein
MEGLTCSRLWRGEGGRGVELDRPGSFSVDVSFSASAGVSMSLSVSVSLVLVLVLVLVSVAGEDAVLVSLAVSKAVLGAEETAGEVVVSGAGKEKE